MRRSDGAPRRAESHAGFITITDARCVLRLHSELASEARPLLAALEELRLRGQPGLGNRGGGFRVTLGGVELFVRQARRGGMMSLLSRDLFLGLNPRPLRELRVAGEAFRRGIPVPEPMGAVAHWIAPGIYRGFFLSRAIAGMSLWEFIRADDDPLVRRHVLEKARATIGVMHDRGLFHADLNLHNLMVTSRGDSFAVMIVDLDKARLFNHSVPPALRRRNGKRLLRSAHKLDPGHRYLDPGLLALFELG